MEVKVYHRRVAGVAGSPEQLLEGEREWAAGQRKEEGSDRKLPPAAGIRGANHVTH